jgi:hypothetical protein
LKTVTKSFRINESENEIIQEKAKLANMDESTLIRNCILNDKPINIVSHNAEIAKEIINIEILLSSVNGIDVETYDSILMGVKNIWQLLK